MIRGKIMKLNSIFLSHKKGTENSETIAMPLPARVKISMSQHMGAPCEPTVPRVTECLWDRS